MNPPNWVDTLLGAIGVLGFLLAVYLAWIEIHRYRLKLHLIVHCYRVEYFNNQESVVWFRLSFVNPASAGKTLNRTSYSQKIFQSGKYNKPSGIAWKEPSNQYDIFQNIVSFSLPNNEHTMPADEMLQYPLDIPPHQSRTRWLLLIANLENTPLVRYPIVFQAFDVFDKKVAEKRILIPIEYLKKLGTYYPEYSSYISPL